MTKQELALAEVKRKLRVTNCAAFLDQHSALVKAEEARKYREELESVEKQLEVAQIPAKKARDIAMVTKAEGLKIEANYVAEVERGRDEVDELTKQLREQFSFAAAGSKELAAAHAELKTQKIKADFLDGALKVSRKEITTV